MPLPKSFTQLINSLSILPGVGEKTAERLAFSLIGFSKENLTSFSAAITDIRDKITTCEICGNSMWNGQPIPLEVHHINGDRTDNRIENLQLLCPNCHAQTDNYCGKNIVKKAKSKKVKLQDKKIKKRNIPSSEILIKDFTEKGSFRQIGVKYNVSDKAVKKWFIKYNLPSSSIEMRKYIIEKYGKQPQWFSYREKMDYTKTTEKLGIKVAVYDSTGKFIQYFNTIHQASDFTKVNKNTISRALKGKNIRDKRYIFKKA